MVNRSEKLFSLSVAVLLGWVSSQMVQNPVAAQTVSQPTIAPTTVEPTTATSLPVPIGVLPAPELPTLQPLLPEVTATVRLVVKLSQRRVYVYRDHHVTKSYPVAIGQRGWETPIGQFQVIGMRRNPGWTHPLTRKVVPPGPENPLGERWIAFWTDGRNYIGFHGTPERSSVGQAASHGCVRLYNEHIRQLYDLVTVGTPVTVER